MRIERAVVADASSVVVRLVAQALETRGVHVHTAHCGEGLLDALAGQWVDLVVADTELPSLPGLELLERLAARAQRPAVVLMARTPNDAEETAASLAGVLAYLAKPLQLPELARAIAAPDKEKDEAPRARAAALATARFLEKGEPVYACEVLDISETGALLAAAPLADCGEELDLELDLGEVAYLCRARVVRVQEPSWHARSGLGVRFEEVPQGLLQAVRRLAAG